MPNSPSWRRQTTSVVRVSWTRRPASSRSARSVRGSCEPSARLSTSSRVQDEQRQRLAGLLGPRDCALELDLVALSVAEPGERVRHGALRFCEPSRAGDRRHGFLGERFQSSDVLGSEHACFRRVRGERAGFDAGFDDRHDECGCEGVGLAFAARPVRPVDRHRSKRSCGVRERGFERLGPIVRTERRHHRHASRSLNVHRGGFGVGSRGSLDSDPSQELVQVHCELEVVDSPGPRGGGPLDDALQALRDRAHVAVELLEHGLEPLVRPCASPSNDEKHDAEDQRRHAGADHRSHDR